MEPLGGLSTGMAEPVAWHSRSLHALWQRDNRDPSTALGALIRTGALNFPAGQSGLFPASPLAADTAAATGMGDAWLRDNAMTAAALAECGYLSAATRCAAALLTVLNNAAPAMRAVIAQPALAGQTRNCPPARVDPNSLAVRRKHHNAQNDSLGHTLWLVARLVTAGHLTATSRTWATLRLVAEYLTAIEYWHYPDNGCWEESRKVQSSSIGAVLAGLNAYGYAAHTANTAIPDGLNRTIAKGRTELDRILPAETTDPPRAARPVDAAQILLVEPLDIVTETQAAEIISRVSRTLLREHGVARYPGDSYWARRTTALRCP